MHELEVLDADLGLKQDEYAQDLQAFRQSSGSDRSTLGDVFRAAQAAAQKESEEE